MSDVYVFEQDASDFDCTGLVGTLMPTACTHEEEAGGLSAVSLSHPMDEWGKWRALQRGNILKCEVRTRTPPDIDEIGLSANLIEKWEVRETATDAELVVYANKKKNKKKGKLIRGRTVYVLESYTENGSVSRYRVQYEKKCKVTKKNPDGYKWITGGWAQPAALRFVESERIESGNLDSVCPSVETRPQLFRIQEAQIDTDKQQVTVYAPHISFDLEQNMTRFECNEPLTGVECLNGGSHEQINEATGEPTGETITVEGGIMGCCDFEHDFTARTDIISKRTSAEYVNVNPLAAMTEKDTGFLGRWHAELVRDDFDLYFLSRAGRSSGIRLEYGKNLLGVSYTQTEENLYTAILPTGENSDGSTLYLSDDDDPGDESNYVFSPHRLEYPYTRAMLLECTDCSVEKGKKTKKVTKDIARARMREQAEELFSDENHDRIDLPEITATVKFLELGDTEEYIQYRGLETAFLYDTVVIADPGHGVEIAADVHRIKWDCLAERMLEIEVDNVHSGVEIYSWQLPTITGDMLAPGVVQATPVVNIYGGEMILIADADGNCEAASQDYRIIAQRGNDRVTPAVGFPSSGSNIPTGMTVSIGQPDDDQTVTVTVSVAENASLGDTGPVSGIIYLPVTSPVETTLRILWKKLLEGRDGVDGYGQQFVYHLTDDYSAPGIDTEPDQDDDFLPGDLDGGYWTDHPTGISEEHQYEWIASRQKIEGSWTGYGNVALWSRWGIQGTDGDGVEYAYRLTDNETPPNVFKLVSALPYDLTDQDEVTELGSRYQAREYIPDLWTDDPTGVSEEHPYEWVIQRRYTAGVWKPYSTPALWARYAVDGEQGQPGVNGQNGMNVYLSPATLCFTADSLGRCSAGQYTVNLYAYSGGNAATPVIGSINTHGVSGISAVPGSASNGVIPITISITSGSNLGSSAQNSGQISVNITSPITTTLNIIWSKVCNGANGSNGSNGSMTYRSAYMPSSPSVGDLWIDTSNGDCIKRWSGSSWVMTVFGADSIAAGAITADKITTNQIESFRNPSGNYTVARVCNDEINTEELSNFPVAKLKLGYADTRFGDYSSNGDDCMSLYYSPDTAGIEAGNGGYIEMAGYGDYMYPMINMGGHVVPAQDYNKTQKGFHLGTSAQSWANCYVRGSNYTGSDRRFKEGFGPIPNVNEFIMALKPVEYTLKGEDGKARHWGMIAQDVKEALDGVGLTGEYAVYNHEDEERLFLSYTEFIAPMILMLQQQERRIAVLETKLKEACESKTKTKGTEAKADCSPMTQ